MDPHLIQRIVEAALLAASQPLTVAQLQGLFPLDEPAPDGAIAQALEALQADCETRGIELVELASGWRFQVQGDVHAWVARLWTERQTKYTRATLETLALIAYRQPITRGEIEQVRGVATSSNIVKSLEEREWIRVVGHRDIPGRPELLGTTRAFLDYFGLKRLDELPPLSELKDFGELDPQLRFEGTPVGEPLPIGDIALEGDAAARGAPASDDAPDDADVDAANAPASPDDVDATDEAADGAPSDIAAGAPSADSGEPRDATDDPVGDPASEGDEIDSQPFHRDEPQADSQPPALAEDGDSTRSKT